MTTLFTTLCQVQLLLLTAVLINTTTLAFVSPPQHQKAAFTTKVVNHLNVIDSSDDIQNFANEKVPSLLDFINNEADSLSTTSGNHGNIFNFLQKLDDTAKTSFEWKAQFIGATTQNIDAILTDVNGQLNEVTKNLNHVTRENAYVLKESLEKVSNTVSDVNDQLSQLSEATKNMNVGYDGDGGSVVRESLQSVYENPDMLDKLAKFKVLLSSFGGSVQVEDIHQLVDKLQLSEYGPYYIFALGVLITGVQNNFTEKAKMESKLASAESKIKTMESTATNVAQVAAHSVVMMEDISETTKVSAKGATYVMKKVKELEAEKVQLKEESSKEIEELDTRASRKLNELQAEKAMMETVISKLKLENDIISDLLQDDENVVEVKPTKDVDAGARRKLKELQSEKVMMETSISKLKLECEELNSLVKLLIASNKSPVSSTLQTSSEEKSDAPVLDGSSMEAVHSTPTTTTEDAATEDVSTPYSKLDFNKAVDLLQSETESVVEEKFLQQAVELFQSEMESVVEEDVPLVEEEATPPPAVEFLQAEMESVLEEEVTTEDAMTEDVSIPYSKLNFDEAVESLQADLNGLVQEEVLQAAVESLQDETKNIVEETVLQQAVELVQIETESEGEEEVTPPAVELLQDEIESVIQEEVTQPSVELFHAEMESVEEVTTTESAPSYEVEECIIDNPWSEYKDSTLMKKKKSELLEYLAERCVEVPVMVKAEIIQTIKDESSWIHKNINV